MINIRFFIGLFFIVLSTGCQQETASPRLSWQLIQGRNRENSLERPILYRALTPIHWIRKDPPLDQSLTDTTLATCEFFIEDENEKIRLTIHPFPLSPQTPHIPPIAQVNRWKRQFDQLDELQTQLFPQSHGGFSGLFFEGEGIYQGRPLKVLGWSMQLATIYERMLSFHHGPHDEDKRADYTIKASGPPDLVNKHRLDILSFAKTFELIDELPSPL